MTSVTSAEGSAEHADAATDVVLAEVLRGGQIESCHLGAIAAVRGDRVWHAGDVDRAVFVRSAVKPLQALPLLERGIADRLGLGDAELAVISASHDGTEQHVAAVEAVLRKGGLGVEHLQCGPHPPLDRRAAEALARTGEEPQRIHNNCSGKHAGFLLLARDLGQPLDSYLDPHGASQELVIRTVAEMAGVAPAELTFAVDGCGAPTLCLPLVPLARAFLRLVNQDGIPAVRAAGCRRLLRAISSAPVLLGGRGRLGTTLVEASPGRIYPKNGAEGVFAFGALCPDGPVGVAIKVRDGAERGYLPVVVEFLRRLRMWDAVPDAAPGAVPDALSGFAPVPVRNTRRRVVGEVRCAVPLPATW